MTNMPMPSVDDIAPRRDLRIEYRDIDALKPWPRNARTHSRKQIDQIADSMRTFGWTNPILTDEGDGIIAGHGRLEAARKLGFRCVPGSFSPFAWTPSWTPRSFACRVRG